MDEKLKLEKEKVEKAKETVSPLSPVPAAKSVRESLRPSRSVEQLSQISTEPIEVDAGDGTVLKRLRQSFMPNKLQNHHKSIELLHTRQLTSKNLELFEDVPQSQKNTRQSVSIESSLDKVMMQSPSSTNLSEHTGYRSGRSASNVPSSIDTPITREKITTTEPTSATAPYTAMTGLRNTRNSAMLLRSNSKIEPDAPSIVEERERSASSKPNSKSFKDWYINMIQGFFC
jgi:hypothetical protein